MIDSLNDWLWWLAQILKSWQEEEITLFFSKKLILILAHQKSLYKFSDATWNWAGDLLVTHYGAARVIVTVQ